MKIDIVNDADGCPAITVSDNDGNVVNSLELQHSQAVQIAVEGAVSTGPVTPSA